MAILGFELEEILSLLSLVESQGLDKFVWEEGERSIHIRGPRTAEPSHQPQPQPSTRRLPAPPRVRQPTVALASAVRDDEILIKAPMVGTFYRSDKPGSAPIIEVGHAIRKGMPIGIIEAMKIYSEIPSEYDGTVISIPAKDGEMVHSGTTLMVLRIG